MYFRMSKISVVTNTVIYPLHLLTTSFLIFPHVSSQYALWRWVQLSNKSIMITLLLHSCPFETKQRNIHVGHDMFILNMRVISSCKCLILPYPDPDPSYNWCHIQSPSDCKTSTWFRSSHLVTYPLVGNNRYQASSSHWSFNPGTMNKRKHVSNVKKLSIDWWNPLLWSNPSCTVMNFCPVSNGESHWSRILVSSSLAT